MKLIPLTKTGKNAGKYFAQVDDEDFEYLNQWNWHASVRLHGVYAIRSVWDTTIKGDKKKIRMQRAIMNPPEGMVVDHIDHNPLNNQKNNLRICTRKQNSQNRSPLKRETSSKYIGVKWAKRNHKHKLRFGELKTYCHGYWVARVKADKKEYHLGYFKDEKEAALAYNQKAKELFGEFANLNVIE